MIEGVDSMSMNNQNNKVLGILIRSNRMNKGYSLRELGERANISHTLISNIEKGKQIPSNETLRDLFDELDLVFYDDEELHNEFVEKESLIYNHIFNHDYDDAKLLLRLLELKEDQYLFSRDVVDFVLLQGFYNAIAFQRMDRVNEIIEQYGPLVEFFTPEQTQMIYFIQGLYLLNRERYNMAAIEFQQALSLGDKERDVYIKQYYCESLVKQYKFIDTYRITNNIIKEFEDRTIYMRSMKTKLIQARIYYHIAKNKEVYEITDYVERFAYKYNVHELIEECVMFRAAIDIRDGNYDKAKQQLLRMPDQQSLSTTLLRFKIYFVQDNIEEMEKYYNELSTFESIRANEKVWKYLQIQTMSKVPRLFEKEKFVELVKWLIDFSSQNNDQEMITLSYNYLIKFYHQERSYKKALEVAENLLHFKKIRIDKRF